jgi:hypothetical protein
MSVTANDDHLRIRSREMLRERVVASPRERRLVHRALTTGKHVPWDFPTTGEPPDSYVRNM